MGNCVNSSGASDPQNNRMQRKQTADGTGILKTVKDKNKILLATDEEITQLAKDCVEKAFKKFDVDNDGNIDMSEAQKTINQLAKFALGEVNGNDT